MFPTRNAPFQTSPAWIALAAVCHASVPLLLLALALASPYIAWSSRIFKTTYGARADRAALVMVTVLLIFVTLVYTTLQAEPRYSIPFRPFEILLAATSMASVALYLRQRRRSRDLIRDTLRTDPVEGIHAKDDRIVKCGTKPEDLPFRLTC